jgi:hypothetical protein
MANCCYSLMDRNEPGTLFRPRQGAKGFEEFMVVIEIPNAYGKFWTAWQAGCTVWVSGEIGVAFFRHQIEANKVIQRNLHGRWRENPEEFPVNWRNLTEESRPQRDVINRHMLLLTWIEGMPPERLPVVEDLLGAKLATSPSLRQLGALGREVAYLALRSLYEAFCTSPVPATAERQVRSG